VSRPGVFELDAGLASKLASVVVHAQEFTDPVISHPVDRVALEQACHDPDVVEWVRSLGPLAPLPRNAPRPAPPMLTPEERASIARAPRRRGKKG
jgi:hypothetical protein